jgi:methyl-accepting chemotaxis protein
MAMKKILTGTVGQQLGIAFGLIVALILVLALTAWSKIRLINQNFERLVDQTLPVLTALSDVNDKLQLVRTAELKHLAALTMPAKDREEAAIKTAVKLFNASMNSYRTISSTMAAPPKQEALESALKKFNATRSTFLQMSNSAAGAESERAVEASEFFEGPSQIAYNAAYLAVHDVWQDYLQQAMQVEREGKGTVSLANQTLSVVSILSIVLAVALAIFISRRLIDQLGGQPSDVAVLASIIANADLTTQIHLKSHDNKSIVYAMQRMQSSLTSIVQAVRRSAHGVDAASTEIAQGNLDLSERTESQASALQQTAASMEEFNSNIQHNADRALTATHLARQASTVAERGGAVVGQVVETMKGINESSRKIADIISVIDGIAFQTNILALNAAVEAARAGEQGRGFAVVASEVRSLASRSADAAKEIKTLISSSVERVEQGTTQVDEAGTTMSEVVQSIQRVTNIMEEISTASADQSTGMAQIGEAVNQMDTVTQQNAALVEQMAAAASSLQMQAHELVKTVSVFKI